MSAINRTIRRRSAECLCLLFVFFVGLSGCGSAETEQATDATVVPTPIPTAAPTATTAPTPTPTPIPTPTPTPTPGPLTAAQIFKQISPSIAFVDTPTSSGSAVLIDGGYLVTNAHVVWPFHSVRLAFADGEELNDVPVAGWDMLTDMAVLGPIDATQTPLPLQDGEHLAIGADVYLIGYPGETGRFPQPSITRGLISRSRDWVATGITYFQTDATIAGGQSGGVLVSEMGDVIGISSMWFTEAGFGLVASATDIEACLGHLIAGDAGDELLTRTLPQSNRPIQSASLRLAHDLDTAIYIVNEPEGTEVEIELAEGDDGTGNAWVYSVYGDEIASTAGYFDWSHEDTLTFETELEAPYFVEVMQQSEFPEDHRLQSNVPLQRLEDPDDGHMLEPGDRYLGQLDYPHDHDVFHIALEAGDLVNLHVDSIRFDTGVLVTFPGAAEHDQLGLDDDSGGGLAGLNAELAYEAPFDGIFTVVVFNVLFSWETGGYIVTVGDPDPHATPFCPKPPQRVESPFGAFSQFEIGDGGFSLAGFTFAYPSTLRPNYDRSDERLQRLCRGKTACFVENGEDVVLIVEDRWLYPEISGDTLPNSADYVADLAEQLRADGADQFVSEPAVTDSGLEGVRFSYALDGERFIGFATIDEVDVELFAVTYCLSPEADQDDWQASIDFSFNTIHTEGEALVDSAETRPE